MHRTGSLIILLVLSSLVTPGQEPQLIPIDISEVANHPWSIFDGGRTIPRGEQVYDDIPFLIPETENNAWIGFGQTSPQTVTVPIGVDGVTTVHTLINTVWGLRGPQALASLTFAGSQGAIFVVDLVGNDDIRDFVTPTGWTDNINGETTVNAWLGNRYNGTNRARLDRQIITLPPEFAGQTLESLTVTDDGTDGRQRIILAAVTVLGLADNTSKLELSGVCDAAGCQDLISPGAIVSLFGEFADATATSASVPLPTDLEGFSVSFNGTPGAVFGVFAAEDFGAALDQANVQVPWELDVSGGSVDVTVRRMSEDGEAASEAFETAAALASPGIFVFQGTRAIVTNFSTGQDDVIAGSLAQPEGLLPGLSTQPSAIGGVITVWCGGLGPATITPATGDVPQGGLAENTKMVRLLIGGVEAEILGRPVLQPTSVGLNQLNARVPAGVEPGDAVSVVLEVVCDDGTVVRSQEMATIAVRAT